MFFKNVIVVYFMEDIMCMKIFFSDILVVDILVLV